MGLIRNTLTRIQDDLITLERIRNELPRSNSGKHRSLLQQKVMIEQRVQSRIKSLKESINRPLLKATIIVAFDEGPAKRYSKTFYGLTPQEVRDLISIELYSKGVYYTLESLEEINTNSEWEELLEDK